MAQSSDLTVVEGRLATTQPEDGGNAARALPVAGGPIPWCSVTWNPTVGCDEISPGCGRCYARKQAERLQRFGQAKYALGFTPRTWTEHLNRPLEWKKPRFIFVNSMSDLFHRAIPVDYVAQVWDVMCRADWHVFQLLTKRPHRMERILADLGVEFPPHIWLGVSTENQTFADNRIPPLLRTRPALAFVSAEPLLGPVDLSAYLGKGPGRVNWVIDGGESGPEHTIADYDWFRSIRRQCDAAGVPYFHKQGNAFHSNRDTLLDGREYKAMPALPSALSALSAA